MTRSEIGDLTIEWSTWGSHFLVQGFLYQSGFHGHIMWIECSSYHQNFTMVLGQFYFKALFDTARIQGWHLQISRSTWLWQSALQPIVWIMCMHIRTCIYHRQWLASPQSMLRHPKSRHVCAIHFNVNMWFVRHLWGLIICILVLKIVYLCMDITLSVS